MTLIDTGMFSYLAKRNSYSVLPVSIPKSYYIYLTTAEDEISKYDVFPFLHPSYGQCGATITEFPEQADKIFEVILNPGELLYIPPFWIHEVSISLCIDVVQSNHVLYRLLE